VAFSPRAGGTKPIRKRNHLSLSTARCNRGGIGPGLTLIPNGTSEGRDRGKEGGWGGDH